MMVEKTILDHLGRKIDAQCGMERPVGGPASFIVVQKTGESRENCISTAILAVQSYAPSLNKAAELNDEVKTAMFSAVELPGIAAVRLNSDYNFTDTTTKDYRYQAVFDVTYYDM